MPSLYQALARSDYTKCTSRQTQLNVHSPLYAPHCCSHAANTTSLSRIIRRPSRDHTLPISTAPIWGTGWFSPEIRSGQCSPALPSPVAAVGPRQLARSQRAGRGGRARGRVVPVPVLGDVLALADPDLLPLSLEVVEELGQRRRAPGTAHQSAVEADRHHLRGPVSTLLRSADARESTARAARGERRGLA